MRTLLLFMLMVFAARSASAFTLFTEMNGISSRLESDALLNLASLSYRNGDREKAKEYLIRLLRASPDHVEANRFLGALFLMDGNIEASLKYWNRIGEPRIERIELQPVPRIDPVMMDRAFAMAPASNLQLEQFEETASRLESMQVFKNYRFFLKPRRDSYSFDLILSSQVRTGTLSSKIKVAAMAAQAFFSDTLRPELHNLGGTTMSLTSLISWEEHRNRYSASLSLPLGDEPYSRLRIFTDNRFETWSFGSDVELRKSTAGIEVGQALNSRLTWNSGAKISHREYDHDDPLESGSLFQSGWLLEVSGQTDFHLIRIPEKRLTVRSISTAGLGKFLGNDLRPAHISLEQSFDFRWFPRSTTEGLMVGARLSAGKIFGSAPFDEYYLLGADRNSDRILRAHRSQHDKNGENPFGSAYFLINSEVSQVIYDTGKIRARLIPFVDAARVSPHNVGIRSEWFVDAGMQAGLQFLGAVELLFTYGKDLRTGRNVVYLGAKL